MTIRAPGSDDDDDDGTLGSSLVSCVGARAFLRSVLRPRRIPPRRSSSSYHLPNTQCIVLSPSSSWCVTWLGVGVVVFLLFILCPLCVGQSSVPWAWVRVRVCVPQQQQRNYILNWSLIDTERGLSSYSGFPPTTPTRVLLSSELMLRSIVNFPGMIFHVVRGKKGKVFCRMFKDLRGDECLRLCAKLWELYDALRSMSSLRQFIPVQHVNNYLIIFRFRTTYYTK